MPILTSKEAEIIAKKLEAEIGPGRRHPKVKIWWRGTLIAQYGIRRGSGDINHNYIPKQLFISFHEALELARCRLGKDWYFNTLQSKGKLPKK